MKENLRKEFSSNTNIIDSDSSERSFDVRYIELS